MNNTFAYRRFGLPSLVALILSVITLLLSGCGGGGGGSGGGAPVVNDTLTITPTSGTVKAGSSFNLSIAGGKMPYRVYSSNQAIIPLNGTYNTTNISVTPSAVIANTNVTISVVDATNRAAGSAVATLTVTPSTIFQSVTITGILIKYDDAGKRTDTFGQQDQISGGGTGAVDIQTTLPNRTIRLEVMQGAFSIVGTLTPGASISKCVTTGQNCSYTITTDANGKASALIVADSVQESQYATMRVVDPATGDSVQKSFSIFGEFEMGITAGGMDPITQTITVPPVSQTSCAANRSYDVYVFSGNPPYTILNQVPQVVTVSTTQLMRSGDKFTVTTTGTCGEATILVRSATGATRTLTVRNLTALGGTAPLVIANVTIPRGQTSAQVITGGTPPLALRTNTKPEVASATITDRVLTITGLEQGTTTLVISDAAGTYKTVTVTVEAAAAMALDVANITLPTGYVGAIPINIYNGAPPYQIFNDNPAVVTSLPLGPTTHASNTLSVTVANVVGVSNITVIDSLGKSATARITHN